VSKIREVAREYFGVEALGWDASLEALGARLDTDGRTPQEYFAYLINRHADCATRRNTRNSEKVYGLFREYWKELSRHAELNAYLDAETFETRTGRGMQPAAVLADADVEMTPLFRYVMAMTLGFYDLAPRFQREAVQQLLENTEYFRTFAKFKHVFPVKREVGSAP